MDQSLSCAVPTKGIDASRAAARGHGARESLICFEARASAFARPTALFVLHRRQGERRIDHGGGAFEIVGAVNVLLHNERGAAVELLVLLMAPSAGSLRTGANYLRSLDEDFASALVITLSWQALP
jgi:hypothetical protein